MSKKMRRHEKENKAKAVRLKAARYGEKHDKILYNILFQCHILIYKALKNCVLVTLNI